MAVSAQYELCTMPAIIPGLSIIMLVLFTILQRRATQHTTLLHMVVSKETADNGFVAFLVAGCISTVAVVIFAMVSGDVIWWPAFIASAVAAILSPTCISTVRPAFQHTRRHIQHVWPYLE